MIYESCKSRSETEASKVHRQRVVSLPNKVGLRGRVRPAFIDVKLSSVDLNLLVALEALLEKLNVTHAADCVGFSQPTMSRSLSRLRHMFNDDLLVRTSTGLVRTARGEELFNRLPKVLSAVRELIASRTSMPNQRRGTVRVAMADHQAMVILVPLMNRLDDSACELDLVVEPLIRGTLKRLEAGEIDLAIGQLSNMPSGFYRRTLYADPYCCLVRNNHPATAESLTGESFYGSRHAVIAPAFENDLGEVYDALEHILPDRERVIVPNIMTALMMVAESDLILTVPNRMADKMAAMLPLAVLSLPIRVPPHEVTLLWHERHHRNTEHAWLRAEVATTATTIA